MPEIVIPSKINLHDVEIYRHVLLAGGKKQLSNLTKNQRNFLLPGIVFPCKRGKKGKWKERESVCERNARRVQRLEFGIYHLSTLIDI